MKFRFFKQPLILGVRINYANNRNTNKVLTIGFYFGEIRVFYNGKGKKELGIYKSFGKWVVRLTT